MRAFTAMTQALLVLAGLEVSAFGLFDNSPVKAFFGEMAIPVYALMSGAAFWQGILLIRNDRAGPRSDAARLDNSLET